MDIEMQAVRTNGDHGASYVTSDRVTAANGESVALDVVPDAKETDVLLSVQTDGQNGETIATKTGDASGQDTHGNGDTVPCRGSAESPSSLRDCHRVVKRKKEELNEVIFWKVRLWMVILFVLFLILVTIIISLLICSAIHEDVDEKFDPSLFKFPLYFNGNFQLPNQAFTDRLLTLSFNESQTLAADLQEKLAGLYKSSPALGRYFSEAEIQAFRNGSVIADYQLKFLMPEEQQDQLRKFTLSREMVYNVLRQFLYDQESESELTYIDPFSLNMFLKE
ncbi:TPA-induced transmembrane protein homolog [Halichoeres trimaculatus]|uniref:TPA-induced transmembrane protein homolog n=1 Tax=Halichoeres trimaculatus TaxID=147232 RepID=UPI003D9DCD72